MDPGSLHGLGEAEAARRLAADGPNALPGGEAKPLLRIVADVLAEPMFLMLIAAGGIYLALGDLAEAAFLLIAVFGVVGLTLVQQRKTQRALEALRDLSAPRALVVRDGRERRIASREVVRGDIVVLREGDRVPADAVLREGQVSTDESLLTGEAAPQMRWPAGGEPAGFEPGTEGSPFVFASTLVTQGVGLAEVAATGPRTQVGRIGAALAGTVTATSQLQRSSRGLVRVLAAAGLLLALVLMLVAWLWDGRPLLEALLLAVSFAMSILPEEIPVVLTIFLALGAWRLSRGQVLTRRADAVEALGAITVLAVDKTGTLTVNRMRVAQLRSAEATFREGEGALPDRLHELAEFALLATPADPFDPMDRAIRDFAGRHLRGTEHLHDGWRPEQAYPLSREILAMTHVFHADRPDRHLLATKGAPEAVIDLCHLDPSARDAVLANTQQMAAAGLRVLGVARGEWQGTGWPPSQHDFAFSFLGLIGLVDPPRPDVPDAVAACRSAGIRVIMLTGDHAATAQAIAREIGMQPRGGVLSGPEIARMDDATLARRLGEADICARVLPEQKLRLVRALQAAGERVAMTGDGVNDAPALKAAEVGIAMGERGTDVAREAAALVVLDDSFASIVTAIRQGRRIDDNIRRAVRFIFAVHVPIVALALLPVAMHWPLLLLPAQIVMMELVIDPACSIFFEAEPAAFDVMRRPPRPADDSPFAWRNIGVGVLQGLGLAAMLSAGCGALALAQWPDAAVRTAVFIALMGGLVMLMVAERAGRLAAADGHRARNRWLPRLALGVAAMLALVLGTPWLRRVMGFALPTADLAAASVAMLLAVAAWLAVVHVATRAWLRPRSTRPG